MATFGSSYPLGRKPKKKNAQAVAIALRKEREAGKNIPRGAKGKGVSDVIRRHLSRRRS